MEGYKYQNKAMSRHSHLTLSVSLPAGPKALTWGDHHMDFSTWQSFIIPSSTAAFDTLIWLSGHMQEAQGSNTHKCKKKSGLWEKKFNIHFAL